MTLAEQDLVNQRVLTKQDLPHVLAKKWTKQGLVMHLRTPHPIPGTNKVRQSADSVNHLMGCSRDELESMHAEFHRGNA